MTLNDQNTRSQCGLILAHLQSGKTITNKVARKLYGCERLGARICDLRKAGHDIETHSIKFINRYGHHGKYAEYRLKRDQ